ncbi:probable H/ACA ribonucleoprotein complex subunit 1 [Mytilus californianus]|uniref:probable H/ACA ribonucleoprotein complex subunit 1 n=1 Tax=Mytilus californianus TaxID=6549 RepID=UPI0022461503|nr:probable H/ACA ribonucleoprotein complex subunit 1 [Mytilus californianus]
MAEKMIEKGSAAKKKSEDIKFLKDRVRDIEEYEREGDNYDDNHDEDEENPHNDGERQDNEIELPAKKHKKDNNRFSSMSKKCRVGNTFGYGKGGGGGFFRGGRGGHRGSRGGYREERGGFRGGRGRGSGQIPKNSQRGGNPQKF